MNYDLASVPWLRYDSGTIDTINLIMQYVKWKQNYHTGTHQAKDFDQFFEIWWDFKQMD